MTSKPRGGQYCCAGAPNGLSCKNSQFTKGISVHRFPKNPRVKKQWVEFVQRHRSGCKPTQNSVLCSAHFEDSCYTSNRQIAASLGIKSVLKPEAVPTVDVAGSQKKLKPFTARDRRYVSD